MAYLFGDANNASAGKMGGFMAMNRCPSLAEAIEIANGVVSEVDRGASEVASTSWSWQNAAGTMEALTTSGTDITSAVNSSGIGIVCNSSADSVLGGPFEIGHRYRVECDLAVNSGTVRVRIAPTFDLSAGGMEQIASVTSAQNGRFVIEFVPRVKGSFFGFYNDTSFNFSASNFKAQKIGITADLPPSSLQLAPGQWLDESGNKGHVLLPDGMRMGESKTEGRLFAENTFDSSTTGQPICADVPVLPADYQVTLMMKASVSGDFNIGDGSDEDYYAAGVTIGTDWEPVALLKHASDGTNRKIVITPTSSYDGTVSTKVKVERLA